MNTTDHFGGSSTDGPDGEAARIAAAVPRSLALLLTQLVPLTPTGRAIVLDSAGPGSRLLLEALDLADRDQPSLTDLGVRVAELLAVRQADESQGATVLPFRPRLRPIARVASTRLALAAETDAGDPDGQDGYIARYHLTPDEPGPGSEPTALIEVMRFGKRLRIWQVPQQGSDVVVHTETMSRLPKLGETPTVLPNPDDLAPSELLRQMLKLSNDGPEDSADD